jgi:hypothetical protein
MNMEQTLETVVRQQCRKRFGNGNVRVWPSLPCRPWTKKARLQVWKLELQERNNSSGSPKKAFFTRFTFLLLSFYFSYPFPPSLLVSLFS